MNMTTITEVVKNRDTNVAKPSRRDPASVVTLLSNLDVGANYVKAIEINTKKGDYDARLAAIANAQVQLKSSMDQPINRARGDTGFTFVRETMTVLAPSGRLYVQVVVTRVG